MTESKWIRYGGSAALLGGLLFIIYAVGTALVVALNPALEESSAGHAVYHAFNAPPNALLAIGIIGLYLYARQSERFGKLGKVGFYICAIVFAVETVGGLAIIVSELTGTFTPALDAIHPMVLLLMLGSVLFGVAAFRSGSLPRGGALMIIVVPLAMIASLFALGGPEWAFTVGMALYGAGWSWLGYGLWSHYREEAIQPRPAM